MDMFEKGSWPGTLILVFLGLIVAFMVFCVLGVFVDPKMEQYTRQGVVVAWGFFAALYIPTVAINRH